MNSINALTSCTPLKVRVCALLLSLIAGCTGDNADSRAPVPVSSADGNSNAMRVEISGLRGTGLMLQNEQGDQIEVGENGTVSLPGETRDDVIVLRQPRNPVQQCDVGTSADSLGSAAGAVVRVTCATQIPRFAYTIDYAGASTSLYTVDSASGQLQSIGFAATGPNPIAGASDREGRFWFVLNRGGASVSAFARDPVTGKLTESAGSPFATGGQAGTDAAPTSITIHPNGRFVVVTNGSGTHDLAVFSIGATGSLAHVSGSPFKVGTTPFYVTFDRSGRTAYITDRAANSVLVYRVDLSSGDFKEMGRASTGAGPGALTLDPIGRRAYVTNALDGSVSIFAVEPKSGGLSPLGSMQVGDHPAVAVAMHPTGQYIYIRHGDAPGAMGALGAYRIEARGDLVAIDAPVQLPANSVRVAMDPAGRYLFVASRGQGAGGRAIVGSIVSFRIDSDGRLARTGVVDLQLPPYALTVDPSGHYLYASSAAGSVLFSYSIDQSSGSLVPTPERAVVQTRSQPIGVSVLGTGS